MLVQFSIKAQNNLCIRTCKKLLLQKNLQLCYSAILNVELHCSSIVKQNIISYSKYQLSLSFTRHNLSSLSLHRWASPSLSLLCQIHMVSHLSLLPSLSFTKPIYSSHKPNTLDSSTHLTLHSITLSSNRDSQGFLGLG